MSLSKYIILLVASSLFVTACTGGAETVELAPGPAPPPMNVSVTGGSSVREGVLNGTVGFQIVLSEVPANNIDVSYETRSGSATEGTDFVARSETIAILAGTTSATVNIPVISDSLHEPDETLNLHLTGVSSGQIDVATASGTIIDDDAPATVSINDASILEGDSGRSVMTFAIGLDSPSGFDISADFATADGSALAGEDYDAVSGSVMLPIGSTLATVDITVNGDVIDEGAESFSVTLSNPANALLGFATATGTIVNDDAGTPPPVVISVSSAGSIAESAAGSSLSFPITLSGVTTTDISVVYQTVEGSATAGADFVPQSSSVTIPAGSTSTTVDVAIIDDTLDEPEEGLSLQITSVSSGTIGTAVASGIIVDDDLPLVSVSVSSAGSATETAGGSSLSFPITLSDSSTTAIDVTYQTVAGSATAGADFVAQSTSVTIPAGSTSATVDVAVLDDALDEPDEDLSLQILSVSSGTIGTALATGTIVDNDAPPSLSVNDASTAEGDSGQTNLSFTVSLDAASGFDVTANFQSADDTAFAGEDYLAASGSLMIVAGTTSTTVAVTVIGDTILEADESLSVSLTNPGNATVADGDAIGTILNDDGEPTVSVSDAQVTEGDSGQTSMAFNVTLSGQSAFAVSVNYATSDGTATAGTDYIATSGVATVAAGGTSTVITVPIVGDTDEEDDENFTLTLSNPVNATIADASAVGAIVDNDTGAPTVSVSVSSAGSATETAGGSSLSFPITLSDSSTTAIDVTYQTVAGSATAGADFVAQSTSVTIPAGSTSATVDVAVLDDALDEPDEDLSLQILSVSSGTIGTALATGTIVDNDAPPSLSVNDASTAEGDSGQTNLSFTVSLDAASGFDVTANFQSADDTAFAGEDYLAASGSLMIVAGTTSTTVAVTVIGDTILEADESLSVSLTNPGNATVADGDAIGTILNDDGEPTVSVSDAQVTEGDSGQTSMAFNVTLSGQSAFAVSVNYATSDGTATAGTDYIATSGVATVAAGGTSTVITVPIVGDTDEEDDENFTLMLSNPVNATITDGSAIGMINNDDTAPPVVISVSSAGSTAESAAGSSLSFPITLSDSSTTAIDVTYQTVAGSATAGSDFVAQSGSVTIPAGSTSTTIDIAVLDDALDEPDEGLSLQILSVSSGTIGAAMVDGTIVDDDAPPSLSVNDASTAEGDSGQTNLSFTVSLDAASGFAVTANFQSADGTATAGIDYIAASGVVTIAAGDTSTVITVPIVGDADEEDDENFVLGLSNPVNASISDASAVGTITNDDIASPVSVSVSGAGSITESATGSSLSFPITLSDSSTTAIDVTYQTVAGSATAGSDFVARSASVTIPAGSTTTTVEIAVLDDALDEPDENLSLQILSVSSGTIDTALAAGTIVDNDASPSLSISNVTIAEGNAGQANLSFTASLNVASGFVVTANYQSADGTATAGIDYIPASGVATIAAGDTSTVIAVPIVGDTDEENDEDFSLVLSNPVNATIAVASAIGTITNDDTGEVSGLISRPANLTCIAPDRPISNTSVDTEVAFPNLQTLVKPVGLVQPPGDTSQWFVIEKDGRVLRFSNSPSVSSVSTFIDIRSPSDPIDVDSSSNESGLLGMAFHPDYGSGNWIVYLSYMIDGAGTGGPFVSVISRFESKDNGLTLDASDETQLITLNQPFENHNGGQITFGPDGYLYIFFGDGGSAGDPGDRAQNTNNLFGSMLRIDINAGSPYAIPDDNPFSGGALCSDGTGTAACPEIYAWGLRNAWKWSFDDETNQLWLGDVGQFSREEIDLIELGGNYGWRCREGTRNFDMSGTCPAGLIDPVIDYSHSVGASVTGGNVYRGSAIPELVGRYVFGDYSRGKVFASVDDGDGGYSFEQLLDTSFLISAFAPEGDGELLFLNYGGGDIRRIIQAGGNSSNPIPDQLSATGCVIVTDPSQPASGLIPYDINVPFWSDGALKQRWYAIPDNTSIGVAADGDWLFPMGSVLMKNFRLNNQLIETRLFMRHPDGEWAGYTYEWNGSGTDATRVLGGKTKNIAGQDWIYPSGSECLQCHTQAAGFSLGPEHGQLNRDFTYPSTGIIANQLFTADAVDLLTNPLSDTTDNLPRFADPTDITESLEDRARAYLHSNCAGCHRPGGPTPSNMDLRHATPFENTNTCNVTPISGTLGIPGARIIAPGNSTSSVLLDRAGRRDTHGMPPLGSNLVDIAGVQLLSDWINSLSSCP